VDEVTNELLGHVVASDILGDVYVIPIDGTLDNIRHFLDLAAISLPSPEDQVLATEAKLAETSDMGWLTRSKDPKVMPNATHDATVPTSFLSGLASNMSEDTTSLVKRRGPLSSRDGSVDNGSVDSGFFGSNTRDDVSETTSFKMAQFGLPGIPGTRRLFHRPKQEQFEDGISEADQEDDTTPRGFREQEHLVFACPFLRRDPMNHGSCCNYMLRRIRDVKQHLGRKHSLPLYCPRCVSTFSDEDERDDHLKAMSCNVSSELRPSGMTDYQKRQLGKKSPPSATQAEQWYQIFDILFPGHAKPSSPYLNMDRSLFRASIAYQQFIEEEGLSILRNFLQNSPAAWTHGEGEDRSVEAFSQEVLAAGLRAIFDRWTDRPEPATSSSSSPPTTKEPNTLGMLPTDQRLPGLVSDSVSVDPKPLPEHWDELAVPAFTSPFAAVQSQQHLGPPAKQKSIVLNPQDYQITTSDSSSVGIDSTATGQIPYVSRPKASSKHLFESEGRVPTYGMMKRRRMDVPEKGE